MKRFITFLFHTVRANLNLWTIPHLVGLFLLVVCSGLYFHAGELLSSAQYPERAPKGVFIAITPATVQYLEVVRWLLHIPMTACVVALLFLPISSDITRAFEDSEKLREITQDNDHNVL